LDDEDEEHEQERVPAVVARNVERQQRRRLRDAPYADDKSTSALQRESALALVARSATLRSHHRKGDDDEDRNEQRSEGIASACDKPILKRQDDEQAGAEHRAICGPLRLRGHEFAQRDERREREQNRHTDLARQERQAHAMQIPHHALTRVLRLSIASCGRRFATVILRPMPTIDATARTSAMPVASSTVW